MIMIMIMITILINMIRIIIHFKNNSHKHLYIQFDLNLFPFSQMLLKHMQKARYSQCAWRTKTHKKRYIRGSRNYRRRTPTWHWYQSSSISLNSAIRRTPLNHYLPMIDIYLGKRDMSRIQLWKFNYLICMEGILAQFQNSRRGSYASHRNRLPATITLKVTLLWLVSHSIFA